jgi:hypothetical protein
MVALEEIKPGSRLRGLDSEGIAEIVQVARFGADVLNLVFRVNVRVGERLVYRDEKAAFEQSMQDGHVLLGGKLPRLAYCIHLAHHSDLSLARERIPNRGGAKDDRAIVSSKMYVRGGAPQSIGSRRTLDQCQGSFSAQF